jgi:hypothetical protein
MQLKQLENGFQDGKKMRSKRKSNAAHVGTAKNAQIKF